MFTLLKCVIVIDNYEYVFTYCFRTFMTNNYKYLISHNHIIYNHIKKTIAAINIRYRMWLPYNVAVVIACNDLLKKAYPKVQKNHVHSLVEAFVPRKTANTHHRQLFCRWSRVKLGS